MVLTNTDLSALAWTATTIAAAVVLLRLYVRHKIRATGTDDYWMLAALTWAICAAALAQNLYSNYPTANAAGFFPNDFRTKQTMSSQSTYLSTLCSKTSIGILLLRVLGATMLWQRIFIVILLALLWFSTFLTLLQGFFPVCSPALNNVRITGCFQPYVQNGFFQFWSFVGMIVDFAFSTLPVLIIPKLNLTASRKLGLCVLLGLGWIASIFTLIKAITPYTNWSAAQRNTITPIATYLEQALVMICGSLVTLTPLWRWIRYREPIDSRQHLAHPDQTYSRDQSGFSGRKHTTLGQGSVSTVTGGRGSHEPLHGGADERGIHVERKFDTGNEDHKPSPV